MCWNLWHKLVHTWEAWQVELHGKYSVERLHALQLYSQRSSLLRALLVIFVTPLPCVLSVILVDLTPLEAPERGLAHSHAFWLRLFFTACMISFTMHEQCRHYIPALPISITQVVVVALFVSVGSVAIA
ncbi:reverse transcriptase, partial [Globisporangium polare]